MIRINLLPWREQLREERKRQFSMALVASVVIGIVLIFLADKFLSLEIDNQVGRNNYLKKQISEMDAKLTSIASLKEKKSAMLSRTKIIQSLQSDRQVTARLLDQFVRTLPEGVYYTFLDKKDTVITIQGITASNNRVSQLMRNFENSPWLKNPNLTEIVRLNKDDQDDKIAKFTLTVNQSEPNEEATK